MSTNYTIISNALKEHELTDDEALYLAAEIIGRYGLAGTVFGRADAETEWQDQFDEDMTDDDWAAVRDTYAWRRGMGDILTERGWDFVQEAVREAEKNSGATK